MTTRRIRLVTYNILLGGRDGHRPDRRPEILEVIRSARPDVLALEECTGFEEDGGQAIASIEAATGLAGTLFVARSRGHIALFWPRAWHAGVLRWDSEHFHHGLAMVELTPNVPPDDPGAAAPLRVGALHLDPWSEDRRLDEARWLVRQLPPGPRTLVLGDFNSLSSSDWYGPETVATFLEQYTDQHHGRRKGWRADVTSYLSWAGYIEAATVARTCDRGPTYPTAGIRDPEGSPGIRIDHVWISPDLAASVASLATLRDAPADRASDHYPVIAEIEL